MNNYLTYRDAFFASSADTMEYVIKQGDTYIFRGIAIKAPGADYAYIDVGKICRQYIENNLPDFRDFNDQITRLPNACQKFTLSSVYHNIIWTGVETYLDDVTEQVEEIYRFLFNWDYDHDGWNNEDMPLSDPVNGHMDCRMKLIYTQYGETVGGDFYVTPLLSSPVQGATLTAKITTDYEDPSKLSIIVGNSDVIVQDYDLHSATFVTPANDGKTISTTAYYYYEGELVGKTEIILAGEQGGEPENTDPILINGGDAQIPGTPFYTAVVSGLKDYLASYNAGENAVYSVTGSEYITGQTYNGRLYIVLKDNTIPAPLGEQVNVSATSNGVRLQYLTTVTSKFNGLYGDGGVTEYAIVDNYAIGSTSTFRTRSDGKAVVWNDDASGYGSYFLVETLGGKFGSNFNVSNYNGYYHYLENNVVYSSLILRHLGFVDENNGPVTSVTINNTVTRLKINKSVYGTHTGHGLTDIYYNGTLNEWNALANVDLNTYGEGAEMQKCITLYNSPITALTVHCSNGTTTWGTPPYITGDTVETYIDRIQIPGSQQAANRMQLKVENEDLISTDLIGTDEYFTLNRSGRELYWNLSGGDAPLGHTFSGDFITGWTFIGSVDFEVTSIFVNTGDTVAAQKTINETVSITASPVEVGVGASYVNLRYSNPPYPYTYVGCTISFNTLFAESALTENYRQSIETASTDGSITVSKSAKNNTISISANNILTENVTVTLNASGYVGYYVSDVASNYGVTDIYIADTVEWFSGLPSVKSINSSGFNTIKSRWYKGVAGKSITVHCTNGIFTWSPDETV